MFFQVNDQLCMGAETYETRNSWGHKAYLYRVRRPAENDELIESVRVRYYNRTWERYQFESALEMLIDKALKKRSITTAEHETLKNYIKNYQEPNTFEPLVRIAKMGEFFGNTPKEKNDWKTRMLKAGLPGLDMPEDWESLDEAEKEVRLNKVIEELGTKEK